MQIDPIALDMGPYLKSLHRLANQSASNKDDESKEVRVEEGGLSQGGPNCMVNIV